MAGTACLGILYRVAGLSGVNGVNNLVKSVPRLPRPVPRPEKSGLGAFQPLQTMAYPVRLDCLDLSALYTCARARVPVSLPKCINS